MIIIGKPSDVNKFIKVDGKNTKKLHKLGFIPIYRDGNDIYFVKNKDILEVLKDEV